MECRGALDTRAEIHLVQEDGLNDREPNILLREQEDNKNRLLRNHDQ